MAIGKTQDCRIPESTTSMHILGHGLLGGIGFTMSILIALFSFQDELHQNEAKFY